MSPSVFWRTAIAGFIATFVMTMTGFWQLPPIGHKRDEREEEQQCERSGGDKGRCQASPMRAREHTSAARGSGQ